MCSNCKPIGIKLDGDKLVTVYSPGVAETLADEWQTIQRRQNYRRDIPDDIAEMNYARTKQDQ